MSSTTPPTRARFVLLAFLGSLVFVLYLDRICIAKAAPQIQAEMDISTKAMSWVFGAFTAAYGIFEVLTGGWGDKYGSRRVLTRIVIWWSVFTALTGCVPKFALATGLSIPWGGSQMPLVLNSFVALLLVRFLFGAGEAGALPNNARVIAQWFPLSERSLVQGIVITCMQLGGTAAPVIAAYLIAAVQWRWTFVIFGSVGIVWAAAFYWWFRDAPENHPAVNEAELELIRSGGGGISEGGHSAIPWKLALTSPNIWLLGGIMACSASTAYMVVFWFSSYLEKARGVEEIRSGWLTGMILGGGAVGSMFGGWLSRNIDRWTGEPRWGRSVMGFVYVAAGGGFLAAGVQCESALATSVCAAMTCFCIQSQQANWWSTVTAISGKHVGALFGLMNSMGVPAAFCSPIFLASYVEARKAEGLVGRAQWDPAISLFAFVLLAGGICWLFVNPTRPVVVNSDS